MNQQLNYTCALKSTTVSELYTHQYLLVSPASSPFQCTFLLPPEAPVPAFESAHLVPVSGLEHSQPGQPYLLYYPGDNEISSKLPEPPAVSCCACDTEPIDANTEAIPSQRDDFESNRKNILKIIGLKEDPVVKAAAKLFLPHRTKRRDRETGALIVSTMIGVSRNGRKWQASGRTAADFEKVFIKELGLKVKK